jgi:aerobic-type carbon monoxide dehydrogenase small subunit (CoxS/CutS family)
MRIEMHPILGEAKWGNKVTLTVDGEPVEAIEGEPIATALLAAGRRVFRHTTHRGEPRGVFCALGRCTDCVMIVDGQPNVRTCVTPASEGMIVETQHGLGHWGNGPSEGEEA